MPERRDVAILDDEGDVAALVTITPMSVNGRDVADDARDTLVEAFDCEATPVEVARDE
ncbi:hypothetical protein HALG_00038 [Halorubrum virus CGphi46]|uniref:Uncharacterized protein n=1 Tax=Halorubrum virus CGphi46 TaxID=754066 RepID=R9TMM9_9CAUD|nr:hypothetical protein HALG_00038 [Halorubrum virus CGphi46]AGN33826.1 hypothetical protein HALG_00038 [Halorubrum virus CGphi46]